MAKWYEKCLVVIAMRIATGIISLVLMLVIFLQSCAVYVGGSMLGEEETAGAASSGLLVAFLFLLGGAFVFKLPKVSIFLFVGAALLAFLIAAGSTYSDMYFWGSISIILAVMSFFGSRKSKKRKDDDHDHDDKIPPGEYRIRPEGRPFL